MRHYDDLHSYEPSKGHGLPHDPLNAIVGPRPIGWISSKGRDGSVNLAPYSFFNLFNYRPPIIGFCSTSAKDSLRNAQETGVFVWNLATRDLATQMNATSAPLPYGVNEFQAAGLTQVPGTLIDVPRVGESPVHFECRVTDIHRLRRHDGTAVDSWLVMGEAVVIHIARSLLVDGVFDTFGAGIILRGGGPSAYAAITPDSRFDMDRPSVDRPSGR
ncbi:flavin reductase family protein [Nitrospirillum sp. BR 11828]|uniref:flavin reductase family protein n=1 Tax=Nitrospirillum sp. BR 11828 TaxID=3104325 RepID=UPI002ACA9436|nr:flavin reductase family protein [Nitrospirillum sp. BR 11828]MDZ5650134.1 flavin reductase family protein [Nitrospirillum sp. BR 11828]